jgi:hypothetical protein
MSKYFVEIIAVGILVIMVSCVIGFIMMSNNHYGEVTLANTPPGDAVIFSDTITVMNSEMLGDSWGFTYWSVLDTLNRGYYTDIGHQSYIAGFKGPEKGKSYEITYWCNSKNERHIITMVDVGDIRYKCNSVAGTCK